MSIINYKEKAEKYKFKYLELKKKYSSFLQHGGLPEWYEKFSNDLNQIYRGIKMYYTTQSEPVLTGSGAIAYLLRNLNMLEDLDGLDKNDINPHDLDFLYISRTGLQNPHSIASYQINPMQQRETSVTFSLPSSEPSFTTKYIKSFDVSKVEKIKSFELGGIQIINLNSLKSFYISDQFDDEGRKEKDTYKKALIEKIITKIHKEGRLHEYGLDEFVTTRTKKSGLFGNDEDENSHIKKKSGLFGNDEDEDGDENENSHIKKKSGLFGNDEDEDGDENENSHIKKKFGLFGNDEDENSHIKKKFGWDDLDDEIDFKQEKLKV